MGIASEILKYDPVFLLSFSNDGSVTNLSNYDIKHDTYGSGVVTPLTNPVVPSQGAFGKGLMFTANATGASSGSSCHRVLYSLHTSEVKALLRPRNKLTVIMCCTKTVREAYGGFMSCTQTGGWNIQHENKNEFNGTVSALLRANNTYLRAGAPPTLVLNADANLIIKTYDGRYLCLYINGVLVGQTDAGAVHQVQYSSGNIDIVIGAEAGSSVPNDYIGLGVGYAALLSDVALTEEQANELYDVFSRTQKISGILTHDDTTAGELIRVRAWRDDAATLVETDGREVEVLPDPIDGSWSVDLPKGKYELAMYGKSGYAPIIHGPVEPV